MITQLENNGLGQWLIFGANFCSGAKNVFEKKIWYSFLLCKFEKEASKKEKIAKVLKPQKFKKLKTYEKHWFRDYQSKTYFIFMFR
jgi:hypothetical protein